MTTKELLNGKIQEFYNQLSDMEALRLTQLRGAMDNNNLLGGNKSFGSVAEQAEPMMTLPAEEREKINKSLGEKLDSFQKKLSKDELTEFLVQVSGSPMKHQSSFGVSEGHGY